MDRCACPHRQPRRLERGEIGEEKPPKRGDETVLRPGRTSGPNHASAAGGAQSQQAHALRTGPAAFETVLRGCVEAAVEW